MTGPDARFWSGRRVVVTGHTGFKGSWLSFWLKRMGAEVMGYALDPPTSPNLFEIAGTARGMSSVIGDIRDDARLGSAIAAHRPEIVFHLAAQSLVRLSYREPVETFDVNVMGTVRLLEACRRVTSIRAIVVATSDKCYENREWDRAYVEDDAMGGSDPYSSSKGCAELAAAAYRRSFLAGQGIETATVRAGNVIGGGDWSEARLIPDILAAFAADRPVVIRYPGAVRPWQHVLEPLAGYMMLAERLWERDGTYAEGWNFGPDEEGFVTVARVVDAMASLWGGKAGWLQDQSSPPHEARLLKLDSGKACRRLGWRPRWGLEQALAAVIDWHKAFLAGADVTETMARQIDTYCLARVTETA